MIPSNEVVASLSFKGMKGPSVKVAKCVVRCSYETTKQHTNAEYFQWNVLVPLAGGMQMDVVTVAVQESTDELKKARAELEITVNSIKKLGDAIKPLIDIEVGRIRAARMTIANETSLAIVALKDVRKFFLDDDYQKEVQRLREFIDLCERLDEIRQSGLVDAVSDAIIKLSIGGSNVR